MATRETADGTSFSGVNYPGGSSSTAAAQKNIKISKDVDKSLGSLLGKNGAFNGHAVEVWADGAVLDTTTGNYLRPGTDFNPGDLQRK